MSDNQLHQPSPSVNRINRQRIIRKRIKNLVDKGLLSPKLARRLAQYKSELK